MTGWPAWKFLVVVACICFALGVLVAAGTIKIWNVDWTDAGLFFGFLSFLFRTA
jgi:hypothetical protein